MNQNATQGQDVQAAQKASGSHAHQGPQGTAEDQFTPSGQNVQSQDSAQAAGLFSVSRFSFFSTAADFLLGQTTAPQANPATGVPPSANGNAAAPQNAPAPGANTAALAALVQSASTANQATSTPIQLNVPSSSGSGNAAATTSVAASTSSASTQQQLQALNQALAALGLDPQDIQKLGRIASVINDFNPQAFTALVFQLEQLAQQVSPQATSASGGNTQPNSNNTTPAPAGGTPTPAQALQMAEDSKYKSG